MLTDIKNIKINSNLPLLICDADEVIFQFMNGFENFLNKKDLYFAYESFMLLGNIKKIKDDSILQKKEIPTLINNFFREYAISLKLIDGSKKILKELSKLINIVILTNMPTEYVHKRVQALENNEMFYNVISNKGLKGHVCAELEKKTNSSVIFIDDSPNQIASVATNSKKILKIHFLQHPKLLKILPEVKESDFNTREWKDIKKIILKNI